jgi:hypothetical protein
MSVYARNKKEIQKIIHLRDEANPIVSAQRGRIRWLHFPCAT